MPMPPANIQPFGRVPYSPSYQAWQNHPCRSAVLRCIVRLRADEHIDKNGMSYGAIIREHLDALHKFKEEDLEEPMSEMEELEIEGWMKRIKKCMHELGITK